MGAPRDPGPAREASGAADGAGLIRHRSGWKARLNAWRKRTPLNPYWTERRHLHAGARRLAEASSGVLLDIGGAERPYGEYFNPRVSRYVGLEYPPMADNLVPELWGFLPRVRHVVDVWGDGNALPFATESADCVLLLEVLEHVPRPENLLREAARVLRPGGRVLLTVPFMAPLHQLPYDYYRFTDEGLRKMFEAAGLETEWIAARGNAASAAGMVLTQYLMRTLGARRANHDGSVSLSRWRAPLVLPLLAVVQGLFAVLERLTDDTSSCLGWSAVAIKPARHP
ncbi:MAG TPA: class I SAM-dependent methyltransferase [Planctomycetota bacterium]|nr:class I SAM-dependent methyltransferase [Planctomycetota bacterium]